MRKDIGKGWGLLGILLCAAGAAQAQDQIDERGPVARELAGAKRTGEALWPVPPKAQWGQVIEQKGKNIWKDAVFTDPKGRWQLVYPSTMTEPFGGGRDMMWRYPGQPHISCAVRGISRVFDGLGDEAAVMAPQALAQQRDALVERARDPAVPATHVGMVALPGPDGMAGTPVQAIMFDQRGKLLAPLGIEREVVSRNLLVSDGNHLLHVYCTAHSGQKSWVEKHVPLALRLTALARENE